MDTPELIVSFCAAVSGVAVTIALTLREAGIRRRAATLAERRARHDEVRERAEELRRELASAPAEASETAGDDTGAVLREVQDLARERPATALRAVRALIRDRGAELAASRDAVSEAAEASEAVSTS